MNLSKFYNIRMLITLERAKERIKNGWKPTKEQKRNYELYNGKFDLPPTGKA